MLKFKRSLSVLLVLTISMLLCVNGFAVNPKMTAEEFGTYWTANVSDDSKIALTPGSDETIMNFAWLSGQLDLKPEFKIGRQADLSDAVIHKVSSKAGFHLLMRSNKVSVSGLSANTTYFYSYTVDGEWRAVESFKTGGSQNFKALFISDVQIGRSGDAKSETVLKNDTYGWYSTLYEATRLNNDISFVLSAGDQVETAITNKQYNCLLMPAQMRNLPFAATIGNHDFYWPLYSYHFNNPNEFKNDLFNWPAGHGYYFTYNQALFIVLDSNSDNAIDHEQLIRKAILANPNTQWRIVMMHHPLYDQFSGEKGDLKRALLAPIFDKFEINLVLNGHNHSFSRSYPIKDGKIVSDGTGTVYVEAGSASGSNYGGTNSNPPETIAAQQTTKQKTYTTLNFSDGSLVIDTFYTDGGEKIDSAALSSRTYANQVDELSLYYKIMTVISNIINAFTFWFR